MNALSLAVMAFVIVHLDSSHAGEKDVRSKLIGHWEVVKSEDAPAGASVEFTKGGKLILTPKGTGKKIEARYTVEGNKFTTTRTENGKEEVNVLSIKTLDETTLITLSDKGKKDELKRVKRK